MSAKAAKKRSTFSIVLSTVVLALIVVFAVLNITASEKKIEQQISHSYAIDGPQFSRTMGLLLGPPIVDGNRFQALVNGD